MSAPHKTSSLRRRGKSLRHWIRHGRGSSPRTHIISGTIATLMVLIASWGVGWLPTDQLSLFARSPLILPLRTTTVGVTFCAALLVLGGLILFRSWIRLGQSLGLPGVFSRGRGTGRTVSPTLKIPRVISSETQRLKIIRQAIIAWTVPLMFTVPILSRDVYSYLVQGRVLHAGLNPYSDGVSTQPGWFMQGAHSLWAESPSPYGPLFLQLSQLIWFISGGIPEVAVLYFRIISLGGLVLCMWAIPALAKNFGARGDWALWIGAANPLFGLYLIAGVHNDAFMTGLLLAGFYLLMHHKFSHLLAGLALIGLSVAVKPLTVVALPFAGLMIYYRHPGQCIPYLKRFGAWLLTGTVVLAVMTIFGALSGLWFGWFTAMFSSGDKAFPFAPYGLLGLGIGWLIDLIFHTEIRPVADIVYALGKVIALGIGAAYALSPRVINPVRATGATLIAFVLLAPVMQPWYVMWILPLLAVVRVWRDWVSWVLFSLVMLLIIIGAVDQISVEQWMPALQIRIFVAALGIIGAGWIIFVDPLTKFAFPNARQLRHSMRHPRRKTTIQDYESHQGSARNIIDDEADR